MPTHIARIVRSGGAKEIVAATRIGRSGPLTVDEATEVSRTARLLMRSPHPNLAPVREVMVRDSDMLVVGAWVEGENLGELWAAARSKGLPLPLAVTLRILLDVLSGLEALHSVRLAVGAPAGLVHAEVIPSNVIVGTNGVTRLIHAYRIASSWSQVPDATRYVAPEVLMRERGLDGRADVYSVGALLWEAMAGKPLMDGSAPAAVVKQLAAGPLPAAPIPRNAAWAAPLVPLVQRALSVDRDERFADTGSMRDALHAAVGSRVAPVSDVARWVRQLAWTQISGRTKRFEDDPAPRVSEVDIEVVAPVPVVAIGTAPIPAAPLASSSQLALAAPQPPPVTARRPPAPPAPKALEPPDLLEPEPAEGALFVAASTSLPVDGSAGPPKTDAAVYTPPPSSLSADSDEAPNTPSRRRAARIAALIALGACLVMLLAFGLWKGWQWATNPASTTAQRVEPSPPEPLAFPVVLPATGASPAASADSAESSRARVRDPAVARAGNDPGRVTIESTSPEDSASPAPAATPDPIPAATRAAPGNAGPRKTDPSYQPLGI